MPEHQGEGGVLNLSPLVVVFDVVAVVGNPPIEPGRQRRESFEADRPIQPLPQVRAEAT